MAWWRNHTETFEKVQVETYSKTRGCRTIQWLLTHFHRWWEEFSRKFLTPGSAYILLVFYSRLIWIMFQKSCFCTNSRLSSEQHYEGWCEWNWSKSVHEKEYENCWSRSVYKKEDKSCWFLKNKKCFSNNATKVKP